MDTNGQAPETKHVVIARELKKIYDAKLQRITPDAVVAAAKPKAHPLHSFFEWDNRKAGNAFRVYQARLLIQNVRFEIVINERTILAPMYVRDQRAVATREQGYTLLLHAKEISPLETWQHELAQLETWTDRVRAIAAALGFGDRFDKTMSGTLSVLEQMSQEVSAP